MSLKQKSLSKKTGKPLIKSLKAGKLYLASLFARGKENIHHWQLKIGKNRSWEPFSKGMTHGFVLEFESQEELDYYLTAEPVHLEFSKNAGPLMWEALVSSGSKKTDKVCREDSVVVDIKDGILFGAPAKKPLGENEYLGSCHCQSVTWTEKLDVAEHVLCHCRTCQQLGGGPYSCNQIIPKEAISILTGTPKVYRYTGASSEL